MLEGLIITVGVIAVWGFIIRFIYRTIGKRDIERTIGIIVTAFIILKVICKTLVTLGL